MDHCNNGKCQTDKSTTMPRLKAFLDKQSAFDVSMTLAELSEKLGDSSGCEVAGYVFVWDKYVYDVAVSDTISVNQDALALHSAKSRAVLNLNTQMSELIQQARDEKLDEVAGYIYTEDKYTFIVASAEAELAHPPC
ncbi:hypothetical protein [Spartinivicinus poritis]|uniref:Uncharacterized protein n=1 Tax=Spartinivicinus poritis TaxID=2994640 RepID=A0ABT5UF62_9GAMM|nr:hypothetical protein [Spartinivicinus sp. A2-2]MDE1465020.1 hypothetical protein [Spartinivicinus sp. A2-2]